GGWPGLAAPLSGARRGPAAVSTYDDLLRAPRFAAGHRPDLVVRVGGAPTSKAPPAWLDPSAPQGLDGAAPRRAPRPGRPGRRRPHQQGADGLAGPVRPPGPGRRRRRLARPRPQRQPPPERAA